jgi:hypothetical protein
MELKIEYISVNDLKPYEKNNKKHEDFDIGEIAKSISKYEMIDPVGIWGKNNTIVEGHGRVLACKQLSIDKVPCIRLDHLTDEQRREYAIVHNKSSELALYDFDNLADELAELDLSDFEFDFGIDTDEEETEIVEDEAPEIDEENEKEEYAFSVNNILNLEYAQFEGDGKYDIPVIKKQNIKDIEETDLMSFNYCLSTPKYDCGVHFYLHDYQFERVWNNPEKYIEILKRYKFVLSPDFSPYSDMPKATKIFNVYRNRWCGRLWQEHGINVIPTVTWSDEESLEYCLDGVEKGSTIAISTIGDGRGHENLLIGWDKMIEKIQPKIILRFDKHYLINVVITCRISGVKAKSCYLASPQRKMRKVKHACQVSVLIRCKSVI